MNRPLKLSEKLFCLAVNPKKGGIFLSASSVLGLTLTGTILVELLKKDIVMLENKRVHLINPSLQSDEVHEFLLQRIRERKKDRRIRSWISYFGARSRKIQKLLIRDLSWGNVLKTEERRFLFIPYQKVFLMDRGLVESVVKEVENAIFAKGERSDEATILAIMAEKTNLFPRIFPDKTRRKEAARLVKKLPETEISKAVQEAIQMARAAMIAATT